jgi:hypothetical protein
MDSRRFDTLAKSLSATDTRRRIVRLLAVLPLGVTLTSVFGHGPDATAKKKKKQQQDDDHGSSHRHRRRKTRNARRSGDGKDNRKGKRKRNNHQPDPAPVPGCAPNSDAQTCVGHCGTVQQNNCGQNVTCSPCPAITTFTASPTTIDRGATPAEEATLSWSTSNATTCSIDNGVGSVPCNGNTSVGPDTTTIYTLSASGPGGGPVTAQTTVTVEYCHSITSTGHTCSTSNTEFCRSQAISATSSDDAKAACEACYGPNLCINIGCGAAVTLWEGPAGPDNGAFQYAGSLFRGEILGGVGAVAPGPGVCAQTGARWAP